MNNLLQIGATHDHSQLFSYDATFELGDIYVSAFLMRHVLFHGAPAIPVSFLLHERKLESSHEEFMKFISSKFPIVSESHHSLKFSLVTDEERAICSAIDKWLPAYAVGTTHFQQLDFGSGNMEHYQQKFQCIWKFTPLSQKNITQV